MSSAPPRILVNVDFTEPSVAALEAAYLVAQTFDGTVHLLHATTLPPFIEPGLAVRLVTDRETTTVEALAMSAAKERLASLLAAHPAPRSVTVTSEVQYGLPLEVIERTSRGFDLVVVGTHGRTGIEHLIVGSVAERVVRHVDRPVLVARRFSADTRRVLAPVDFSNASRAAFRRAVAMASALGAELRLLHVVPLMPALSTAELMVVGDGSSPMTALDDYALSKAREDMSAFMSAMRIDDDVSIDVRIGDPADEIIATARDDGVDLIVMGTHGRTDWAWVGVGSVAERVVREAPCSVLTTRWSRQASETVSDKSSEFTR